jgi:hypothetical protein
MHAMDNEWAGIHDVCFGGAEGSLTIRLGPGPLGSLVSREARVEFGPLVGTVSAFLDFDPVATRHALRELLHQRDLTGDVYLTESEHREFRASASIDHGRGVLTMKLETGFAMQNGRGTLILTTDQSHLNEALKQIERALRLG